MEVPWEDIAERKELDDSAFIRFGNGKSMRIMKPRESYRLPEEFSRLLRSEYHLSGHIDAFEAIYGDLDVFSNYDFARIMLQTSPNDISFLQSPVKTKATMALIVMKLVEMPGSVQRIENFADNDRRGFLFLSEILDRHIVTLWLFDKNDRWHLLSLHAPRSEDINAQEIDTVITSFRNLSEEQ